MMRWTIFSLLLLISFTSLGDERLQAANKLLLNQLNFILLASPDDELRQFKVQLTTNNTISPAHIQEISQAIAYYWQKNAITTRYDPVANYHDPYFQAQAAEPLVGNYLQVNNRIRYLLWLDDTQQWPRLTPGVWLHLGDRHSDIALISSRLNLLGDYPSPELENSVFSESLRQAVVRFQRRHGLKQDGIIGPATIKWLNWTPLQRAQTLARNFVEKHRYLAQVGPRYLLINIPEYQMVLVDHNRIALRSKVIVGKPYRQTPLIKGQVSNLIINPSWRVPRRLLKYDLLPKVREDGSYISRRNFEVFDYSGEQVVKTDEEWRDMAKGQFPYRLVQKPGEDNTLGRYKFFFPNQYNIYLHDTTDKHLFAKEVRALSSGCIRVEKVELLANWIASNLVRDKQTWVDMQIERTKTQWFAFDEKLPLHLVYWTSWLDSQSIPQFRDDIYNRNQNITSVLHAGN
ncbi:L,D-transpeptidase family protein [Shewanella psychrotolerans]|uniref:L,D-transpeptidase family protein n=1 Tax=Shewanella psychrotolerans TaxID=2864206 RepID=UPI001C6557D5|nr:L,D-transpeptidase family protein [Shewanella psychrotolerans]QYJ99884.1 L,D-transpeptidase family protein [Shewanella psychrotolerans]